MLHKSVVTVSSINDIQFWFKDHQLMLLSQQWDKMQDNLIYKTKDFWENLHVINSESETSLKSLHKWDFVILRSHDFKISWLTVMWPESWQFCMKMRMKELTFSRNLWISHTILYKTFSVLFSTSCIQSCGWHLICMQPCLLPQSVNQQSDCAFNI